MGHRRRRLGKQSRLTRLINQTEALTYSLMGGHTYMRTGSASVGQVLSLSYAVATLPGPVGIAVFSRPPGSGLASSNYDDWPILIIRPGETAPPVGGAIGGP